MIERHGVKGTLHDDIFFTEDAIPGVRPIDHVSVEISRQNANLNHVKERMAAEAKARGATAITNFRYGQRRHKWWQLVTLRWDTESWYGEGDAVAP